MELKRLQINHKETPLGYRLPEPRASWIVARSTGAAQAWARVEVSRDEAFARVVYDTGESRTLDSRCCPLPIALEPRTRYYWRVTVCANDGDRGAAQSWFETGKLDEPWRGKWVAAPFDGHPILTRDFTLGQAPSGARLYMTGLGLYECRLNGRRVCDEALTPFYNDYSLWVQAQTWDVTDLLRLGENRVEVWLGNGWYKGRFGFGEKADCLYGDRMQLLLELRDADGRLLLASDEGFRCRRSPVLSSGIYDGERYDARLEADGETVAAVLADAPSGPVCDRLSPPVRVTERRKPAELLHTPAGEQVLDFGQNMTGWVEAELDLPEGAEVALEYGELLQDGCFYNENLRTAQQKYAFVSAGRPATAVPRFTFFGFRYVRVTGLAEARPEDFTACVVHSDLPRTGRLETGDDKVNRLIQNALWGQRGNFVDVPTDCPQRDERMGWTGDAQVFAPTASFFMDTAAFYEKYLRDMALEQNALDGAIPFVVPDVLDRLQRNRGEKPSSFGSCAWADAATVIPWTLYQHYGDLTLLREQYPMMKAWVDWIERRDATHSGGMRLWNSGFHFADWLALDNPVQGSAFGGTDPYYVASAYYLYSAELTARAAKALGDADAARHYAWLSGQVRESMRREYFTPTGRIAEPTQTALLLALALRIAPDAARDRLARDLRAKLEARGMHLDTGFVGTYFLMNTLTDIGLSDCAYTLLLNEDYPSWLYEVNMGATTVWERWNSVLPDGHVSDTGMNSMNHYAYGSVVEWMVRSMCGLSPTSPGFVTARIAPHSDPRVGWARAEYESASGLYRSGWTAEADGTIRYEVTVPFGCTAVFVPERRAEALTVNGKPARGAGPITLAAGRYTLHAKYA